MKALRRPAARKIAVDMTSTGRAFLAWPNDRSPEAALSITQSTCA